MMRVGIAADHGGFALKEQVAESLRGSGYEVVDFGAHQLNPGDDYPDFIIPLARAVAAGEVERGVALCGSGVGASIAANKVPGVRAGLIHDVFSAHQGVEDDDMNVFCLGGKVIGSALAWELIETFLAAHFSGAQRHKRRLAKVQALEKNAMTGSFEKPERGPANCGVTLARQVRANCREIQWPSTLPGRNLIAAWCSKGVCFMFRSPRADPMDRGARYADRGDSDCVFWLRAYGTTPLDMGTVRVGLCSGLGPCK